MQDNTKRTIKIYWQSSIKYQKILIIVILFIIFSATVNTVTPLLYKNFFNTLTGGQERLVIVPLLIKILGVILIFKLVGWFCWRVVIYLANFYESSVMADLSNYCFSYLHRHSFAFFNDSFVGSLVKRVKSFTNSFETFSDQMLWEIFPQTINIVVMTIVLSKLNIYLGLGVVVWVAIFLMINWKFTKYKLKFDTQRVAAETETTGYLADTITNNTNVKLFNGFPFEVFKFGEIIERVRKLRKFTWDLGSGFEGGQRFLLVLVEVGTFYFSVKLWQKNILTVGDFALIQAYFITIFNIVTNFGRVIRRIYESLADANEMTEILDRPHEIQDCLDAMQLSVIEGEIDFRNVKFKYKKGKRIFRKLDLQIKPHETVALIGPSGAGKTTIVKLLLRMHDINGGQILIDDQDIAKVTQESLWKNISMVPQDPVLFHRTLMENIRYGRLDATDEEVVRAAKLAHCHEFISKLENGYKTYVGERGIKLSGGERQRVAIARAILRDAPILVLDEATSSLDSESERFIHEALDKLMKDKTVMVIAHRLSTIKKADRIIVVDKGGITEEGTHQDLVDKEEGIYKKLWELQVGGFIK